MCQSQVLAKAAGVAQASVYRVLITAAVVGGFAVLNMAEKELHWRFHAPSIGDCRYSVHGFKVSLTDVVIFHEFLYMYVVT